MNVGILTFHNANNYGAVLQAYALKTAIEKIDPQTDVEFIDYICNGVSKQRSLRKMIKGQGLVSALLHYPGSQRRIRLIDEFDNRYLKTSKKCLDHDQVRDISEGYDIIISGSDQVWNRKWNGNDDIYLQKFHELDHKKVSYAASFGVESIPDECKDDYREALSHFSHISVREESAKRIISDLGRDCRVDVDPSLLLEPADWAMIEEKPKINGKFALLFMVPYQEELLQTAYEYADKKNLKLVIVSKSMKRMKGIKAGASSVGEIVGLLDHAETIITNSFHGTAFASVFKKELLIGLNNPRGYNIRAKDLLVKCRVLDDHLTSDCIYIDSSKWDNDRSEIGSAIEGSKMYLSDLIRRTCNGNQDK